MKTIDKVICSDENNVYGSSEDCHSLTLSNIRITVDFESNFRDAKQIQVGKNNPFFAFDVILFFGFATIF